MKKIILSALMIAFTGVTAFAGHGNDDLKIDTKISKVEWIGKKVSGQHTGTILIKQGKLDVHDNELEGGEVVIDMSTIVNTDMEGEWKQKLESHLQSPDFFDVANHAEASLKITGVEKLEGINYKIKGDLTIKGITHPVEFDAEVAIQGGKLGATAEISIDRTLYGIKYGSGKFFEGLGDKMIDDEFTIKFKIAAY